MQNTHLEEYRALRAEIAIRMKLLHQLIALGSVFWVVFVTMGFWIYLNYESVFNTYLLIIPIIFAGLLFNYQDNQRAMESTARYLNDVLDKKLDGQLGWERFFATQKKISQYSNANKLFALLIPFLVPIILLISGNLSTFEIYLAMIDLIILLALLTNFRYKLYRVK